MKFKYQMSTKFYIFLSVLLGLQILTIVLLALRLLNLAGVSSITRTTDIFTVVICAMGSLFCIFMLLLSYKITSTHLTLKFGLFDLLTKKVKVSEILNVVNKKDDKKIYLSYQGTTLDPIIMQVSINHAKVDDFVKALRAVNPKILYTEE